MQRTLRVPPFISKSTSKNFTSLGNIYILTYSDLPQKENIIEAYKSLSDIEYIEHNYLLKTCDKTIDSDNESQWSLAAMNTPEGLGNFLREAPPL